MSNKRSHFKQTSSATSCRCSDFLKGKLSDMGRVGVIFLVMCLVAAFLHESEAWRRRRAGLLHDRKRQYNENRQYHQNHQDVQAFADEMETERETERQNDLGTKLKDQEHDNYYYDNYDNDDEYDEIF
ncbi:hypothetical protein ACROYT_G006390 [Oculina patagonica]